MALTQKAKCKKCKKESTFHVDQNAPKQRDGSSSTIWQCPHCAFTNTFDHKASGDSDD